MIIPDFKMYYRAIMIKNFMVKNSRNRQVDNWSWSQDPEINPHTYGHLFFGKVDKTFHMPLNRRKSTENVIQSHNGVLLTY